LVLKARPTNAPAVTSHRPHRGASSDRSTAHAAATRNGTRNGSGRLSRSTATFTGLTARTRPASVAATGPNRRRTVTHSRATAPAPARALGSSRLQLLTPNRRADNPWIHGATGGLSTLMNPPGSKAAKKKLRQLTVMLRAAAA
jgi:hypothetical protein